ncbi:MAG TPA: hypothetical protein VMW69_11470 [Spirochaetia bacterium]|nr:hypothetical protein [Spirochaetia bacterium]
MDTAPTARQRADQFVDRETQFQLGYLPTEQSNPLTADFHATARRNTGEGVAQLFSVDRVMVELAKELLHSDEMDRLKHSVLRVLESDARIFFGGCGASGRMSVQLEAMWRRFFREASNKDPSQRDKLLRFADKAGSVISGGELAVIQSVEYFEDHQTFGRQQVRDAGVGPKDLFITLGEAGIAWSTIGMALEAEERKAETYFFYCNPRSVMEENLERCRLLFSRERICFIEAPFGPMAITGSTRMQATSLELVCVGYALEWALATWATEYTKLSIAALLSPNEYGNQIADLVARISGPEAVASLARTVESEADAYRRGGIVTYFACKYLFDILADTTERTPTFALPPFPRFADSLARPSWAFAKNPFLPTQAAWEDLLQRPPIGLDWGSDTYEDLKAPPALIDSPPNLSGSVCYEYAIGNEEDASRVSKHPALFVWVDVDCEITADTLRTSGGYDDLFGIHFGTGICTGHRFAVPFDQTSSPLSVSAHLAVKLAFNAISTTTAAVLDRIEGNWMVQVLPTNKKLIDRSIRILSELRQLAYRDAAYLLFETWEGMPQGRGRSESPVAEALIGDRQ